jgi:branched-chain amino acid transport system permease protein
MDLSALAGWGDQVVNGLVLGNLYALLAAGLALIFGVAHLINFAHGSVYMAGSYLGWLFLTQLGWPLWAALPAAMAGSALLGVVLERFAVRPFRKSARVAPLLATLGAGMVLDTLAERIFTPNPRPFPAVVPPDRFVLGGVSLGWLDLFILGATVASALGLFLFLKFSRTGQALRATAQDTEAAQQMGVPVNRVNATAFALASALGGLAGVLVGLYYNTVSPAMGFQAGLKGFTACVLGGLGSVPGAMAGGLVLGVSESLGVAVFGSAARSLVAFGLLLAALLLRPQGIFSGKGKALPPEPLTGTFLPAGKAVRIPVPTALGLFALAAVVPLLFPNPYLLQILTNGWILGLFAVSLTLVAGATGILSLGHAGLMALGAYASGLLTLKLGWPFEAAFVAAGLAAAALGTLIAGPALRLKGHYLSIATLALGEIVNQIILNADPVTGGALGLAGIPVPVVFGHVFSSTTDYYWLTLGVLALGVAAAALVVRSPLGRTLRALREDETAAQALGIRPGRYKALAFAFAGFLAGWAGALTAHLYSYINHETFNSPLSILGLTMVIAGGLGNIGGAVLGAVGLSALPEVLRPVAEFRPLVYGLLLLVALRWRPQGALGAV